MLAIIIPYYNSQFFDHTLASLAKQTNKNFQVYIGNDASPDNPESIILKYKSELNISCENFKNNKGQNCLVAHWERCIELTKDEKWLLILGDDDTLSSNYIEEFYKNIDEIEALNCNVIRFASIIMNEKNEFISKIHKHPTLESVADAYYRRFKNETRSSLSEYIFRKKLYEKHKFNKFPLAWHTDDLAWFKFTEGKHIYTINSATAEIRISDVSISGQSQNFKQKLDASYLFYTKLITTYINLFKFEEQEVLIDYCAKLIFKIKKIKWMQWFIISKFWVKRGEFKKTYFFTKKIVKHKLKNE